MTKIIGINGFKRSGKGEVGSAIERVLLDYNFSTKQVGFADKLKILGAKTLGFTDRSDEECIRLMDECKEEWIFSILKHIKEEQVGQMAGNLFPYVVPYEWHRLTGREYLQNLGNEARNVFGEDFWVDQVLPRPALSAEVIGGSSRDVPRHLSVLNSERVQQEYGTDYLAITDLRYPNEAQRVRDLGGEVWEIIRPGLSSDGHASEKPLPKGLTTYRIVNDGTLQDLRYEVEKALGL